MCPWRPPRAGAPRPVPRPGRAAVRGPRRGEAAFAARGYAQTSVRAIAAAADVNPALVVTYFGGKEALFLEVVGPFRIPDGALGDSPEGLGARLAHLYLDRWEHLGDDDPWPALVRSALTHDVSRRVLRVELDRQLAAPLRRILGCSAETRARISLVQCLIGGMIMDRYLLGLEPGRSLPVARFEAALAGALQHALDGTLAPVAPAAGAGTAP